MNYNVLFHVDLDEIKLLNLAITNIINFSLAEESKNAEIVFVVNGPAIKIITNENAPKEINDVLDKGVSVRICQNAMNKFQLKASDFNEKFQVIPAAIVELIELQNKGFAYIKP